MNLRPYPHRNSLLKKLLSFSCGMVLLANHVKATVLYWDPEGSTTQTTANLAGTWNTTSAQWSATSAQTASPVIWTNGDAACFCAQTGTAATGAFTVSVNSSLTIGGIFNGPLNPAGYNVTIGGTGSLVLAAGADAFDTGGSDGDPTIINVPLTGAGQVVIEGSAQLYLNGTNTYTGGTQLGYSGSGFTSIVNYNNGASFGTGPISLWNTAGAMVAEGSSPITITNMFIFLNSATNYTFNIVGGTGGTTFSGPWVFTNLSTAIGAGPAGNLINISGTISGPTGAGLTKYNLGTLVLSGANTYSGGTTNLAGILSITADNNLGTAPGSFNASSIVLSNSTLSVSNGFTLNANRGITLKAGSGIDVSSGNTLSYGGIIAGAYPLTNIDSGTLSLSGVNTYSGGTVINAGTVSITGAGQLGSGSYAGNITNNGTFTYGSSANQTLSGTNSGSGSLNQNGPGTLTLSANNTYTGGTTISGGTVAIGTFNTPFGATNGTITLAGGNIQATLNRGTTGAENILNRVTVSGNSTLFAATTTGSRYLTFGGPLIATNSGSLTIQNTETTNGAATFCAVFTNTANVSIPILLTNNVAGNIAELGVWNQNTNDQIFSGPISGPGVLWRTTSGAAGSGGRVILTGTNTYSGGTTSSDGELACGISSTGPADSPTSGPLGTGPITVANPNLKISAYGGAQTVGNHVVVSSSPLAFIGTNSLTMSGDFDFGGAVRTLSVSNTALTELSGSILNGGLTVAGGNTLTLAGNNAYTGVTTVSNNSTLALASAGSISNSATVSILAGATLDVSAIPAFALSATNTLSASGTALAATINGAAGGVVSLGSQPITLTYDGSHPALLIAQGTLALNGNAFTVNGSSLAAGTYTLIEQASGSISSAGPYTVTGTALGSGPGYITVSGGNVLLTIPVASSFSGLTAAPSISYGTPTITLSGTVSGAGPVYPLAGETVLVSINGNSQTATISDPTGDFSIAYGSGALPCSGSPYTITYAYVGDTNLLAGTNTATTLAIIPASLSVTATAQTKVYGQTLALGAGSTNFTSSGLVNGESIGSVTLASSGAAASAGVAGSPYPLTPSLATGGTFSPANYAISYNPGSLTVSAAPLTVLADDYSQPYGATNPVFTVTYSNFVNGQTLGTSDVTGAPVLTTSVTTNTDVGTYVITNAIGTLVSSNYSLALVNGALTVTNAVSTNVITASTNPALPGSLVVFTATISAVAPSFAVPTNTIQFSIDGTNFGTALYLTNGTASLTNGTLSHGYHTIEADYLGDTNVLGETNIIGSTNSLSELINTPPVATMATYGGSNNTTIVISVSNLLTYASDPDGDAVSLSSVSPTSTNGATITLAGSSITYTPAAGTNANLPDAFTYTVADTYGATNSSLVVITNLPPFTGPPVNITGLTTLANGTTQISFAGYANQNYLIQSTTNLIPPITWITLTNIQADTNGFFQYNDLTATNYTTQFYRTKLP